MTANANTNTIQGKKGISGTSFSPAGQFRSVHLSLFSKMKTEISSGSHVKTETKRGKPYHKTIAAVFLASLFEVRDNERPNPDDVAHKIHQPRQ